jgi:hypothetical protein
MRAMKSTLIPLLLLAGCATRAPAPRIVQSWESPAAEFPAICMLLQDDGTLTFKGGFQFYNPGKWRQDAVRLTITLGGDQPFPADAAKEQLHAKVGALAAYNEQRRELAYTVTPSTPFVGVGNFYFYRTQACQAVNAGR